jgi:hypothetical protein
MKIYNKIKLIKNKDLALIPDAGEKCSIPLPLTSKATFWISA